MISYRDVDMEIDRIFSHLRTKDPSEKGYGRCVDSLLRWASWQDAHEKDAEETEIAEERQEEAKAEVKEEVAGQEAEEEVVDTPEPKPEPELEPEPKPEEEASYTKEFVRALLADAASRSVLIQPIIAKFVPDGKPMKLSSIPVSSYPKLVEEVRNAE